VSRICEVAAGLRNIIHTANYIYTVLSKLLVSVATRSGRLVAGIAGLNPAGGVDICPLCLYGVLSCVGRGL
jgi:hypothetical protein